ncbi:HCaRG protein [Acanthamoeba castellanii str. Neff]|uniref:HCaRG protein n=1 Tax=Acanthamoeba castellanii (strain ATCC 30010 / Neff) TaxID=1257118 RepID=L8GJ97_ACACF|nr:HCaRG protein [Acanthamoeba castellanii str. Neff]ELR13110.1 HCaRG protein [Acanthamoeba castellanii str. Neff]
MATAGKQQVIPESERLNVAVGFINQIEARRLVQLLTRVVRGLHIKNGRPFNATEEEQLQKVFGFSASELQLVIDSCSFIFERAAYFSLATSARLGNELSQSLTSPSLGDDQLAAFKHVWEHEREGLLDKLRQHSLSPHQLDKIHWRLQLVPGSKKKGDTGKQHPIPQPSAIFQMRINNANAVDEEDGKAEEMVNVEFNHAELYSFFNKLEAIQEQLDALG